MSAGYSEILQSVCKRDNHFKIALNRLKVCLPNLSDEDLFTLPKSLCDSSINHELITKGLVFALLNLHFTPNLLRGPANPGSIFVGNHGKRKSPINHCVYFPRDHVVTLFRLLFDRQGFTHRVLGSIWKILNKEHSKCKTCESRAFFCDEPFAFSSFLDGYESRRNFKPIRNAASNPSASTSVTSTISPRHPSQTSSKAIKKHVLVSDSKSQGVQTRYRLDNFRVVHKNFRHKPSVRVAKLTSALRDSKKELTELKYKYSLLGVDNQMLQDKNKELLNDNRILTRNLADSVEQVDSISHSLKEAKIKEYKLINDNRYLDDEVSKFRDLNSQVDVGMVDSLLNDPDFIANVADKAKEHSVVDFGHVKSQIRNMKQIDMRTSRNNVSPLIVLAIIILRMIGNCSLEKTQQVLVLLGNLVFGQNWVLGSDASNSKARLRSIVPETSDNGTGSLASANCTNDTINTSNDVLEPEINQELTPDPSANRKSKRIMHEITPQTCPGQKYIRKLESELGPLALQSVAQELKDPDLVTSTLMYDGCSIKKAKALTIGMVNTVKDPNSGRITSHYRNIGIESLISTGTDSTFRAVTSSMRDIAVLDSQSASSSDVRDSVKDSFNKVDYVVADAGSEMKPAAKKLSDFKLSLGHEKGIDYIHCNGHVSPAFDSAIDEQLRETEKMLELKDHVSRTFNSTFFNVRQSNTCTMLHAMFRMLGTAVDSNQSWSCQKDFNVYLETIQVQDKDTFFDPNISRFGKESEMCFILTYHFDNVSEFLSSVLRENRVFKACSLYIKCPYFREILTSVALLFYHIYSPFLVAVGAETMFGHRVLTHGQLFSYYPKLKEDLRNLTMDPSPLLLQARLPHLSEFPGLTDIRKLVYKRMADGIFHGLDEHVSSDNLNVEVMKGILTLICEQLLIVIHRQVEEYYGGPDSVVGKALAENSDIINHVPVTSLACEHSVGMLRQSHRRAPTSNMQSHAQFQIIKKSLFFDKILTRKISPDQLGAMIRSARKSEVFKLYRQHKQDDKARRHQECINALDELKKNRKKIIRDKAELTDLVKNHGGPCRTSEDVDDLVNRHNQDPKLQMALLWREIKFQKVVIYCDSHNQRCSELFKKQRQNKKTGKYDQVPLNERIDNLKTILKGSSPDGDDIILPVVPVSTFVERVAAKHDQMKQYKHRAVSEPEVQFCYLSNEFYRELPKMKHIAVNFDDDHEAQKWHPGSIEKVNTSENCEKCKDFALPEFS